MGWTFFADFVLIAFFLVVAVERCCGVQECLPANYQLGDTIGQHLLSKAAYCSGRDGGGTCNVNGGWTWLGDTCYYHWMQLNQRSCPCTAHSCGGGNIYCRCGTKDVDDSSSCFLETVPCSGCSAGQFRSGCGCALTGDWTCSPGECLPCPVGHYCSASTLPIPPTPCKTDQYQDKEGQTACKSRLCELNKYSRNFLDPAQVPPDCVECTPCTKREDIPGKDVQQQLCPHFDQTMGIFSDGKCKECWLCSGKQYAIPSKLEDNCVTDKTQAQCVEQYYNMAFENLLSTSNYEDAVNFQGDLLKVVREPMPWLAGYRRVEPAFRNSPALERRGMLPYYVKCDKATYAGPGYRPTSNQTIIKGYFDTAMPWSDDCSPLLARECVSGYYAKLASYTVARGLVPVLISCEPCPPNSDENPALTGGLITSCTCKSGFVTQETLLSVFGTGQFYVNDDGGGVTAACIDCRNGIYWKHSNGEVWQEAVQCTKNPAIQVQICKNLEFLDENTGNCIECPTRDNKNQQEIPDKDRRGCHLCPVGTMYYRNIHFTGSPYSCIPCSALEGKYQDMPGQSQCKVKRTNCDVGQVISINYDNTRDHDCERCPIQCPEGQITIMSSNRVLHNDTCDGNGASFFGCYDGSLDWSGLSFNPGTRLQYEYVQGQAAGARAHTHACDASLLPPNSDWVTYHQSDVSGAECYFACLHGVNAALSTQLHAVTRSYVYNQRQDLINFLVSDVGGGRSLAITTTSDLKINVDTMWYGGMQQQVSTGTSELSWTMPSWWASSSQESRGFLSNTFLFVDDVMLNFQGRSEMCLSPETAYSLECPLGFVRPSGTSWKNDLKCAWNARNHLYYVETPATYAALITSSNNTAQGSGGNVIGSHSVACVGASPGTKQCKQICESESGDLSRFRAGCTVNCVDSYLFSAQYKLSKYDPSTTQNRRLSWIVYYLHAASWAALGNPYLFSASSPSSERCSFKCRAPETFLYTTSDHTDDEGTALSDSNGVPFSACIPCEVAQQICSLFNPPRFALNGSCSGTTRELRVRDVCSTCALSKPNALLIQAGLDYDSWWTKRSDPAVYGTWFTSAGAGSGLGKSWENVLCRYTCNAGYTSVNNGPTFYDSNPCIPCDNALPQSCVQLLNSGVAVFKTSTMVCGAENNFAPYLPTCSACNNNQQEISEGKYIFFTSNVSGSNDTVNQPYNSRSECLAMCNPSVYHSIYKSTSGNIFVDYPVPYGRLECSLCTQNPSRPCGGMCTFEGYYYKNSSSSCVACNTDPCPLPNHYREMCVHGFTRDAQCIPCPDSALRNENNDNKTSSMAFWSQSLLSAARETQNLITRKWVTNADDYMNLGKAAILRPFPQCKVACVNNYAWINLSTGLSPSPQNKLQPELFCIPCLSTYIKSGLVISSSQPLYSVWNSTNVTAEVPLTLSGSALQHMINNNVRGGCYTCPGIGLRDVIASSVEMCEYKPGKTNEYQGQSGIASISIAMTNSDFNLPSESNFFFFSTNRRLLQNPPSATVPSTTTTIQVKVVNVRTHPVISNGDYFYCCLGLPTRSQIQDCQMQLGPSLEVKKNLEGLAWGTDYCTAATSQSKNGQLSFGNRNLLSLVSQQQYNNNNNNNNIMISYDDPGTCFSGTYKDDRGKGPCYLCPLGSSTEPPWSGATNLKQCVCMPGYYSIRNLTTGMLINCIPCGRNFFRSIISSNNNDSICEPCPANSYTPTWTSEYCYCNPGTYKNLTYGSCVVCEQGFYCANEIRQACPLNSMSAAGSTSRGDCICNRPLYYGSLNDSQSQCMPSPPGLKCNTSGVIGAMTVSCGCALGWSKKIVESSFNQDSNTAITRIECESRCLPGQYAVLSEEDNSILRCVFCPENSYSSTTQAIEISGKPHREQCIPCPPNFYTGGKEGVTSVAGCKCNGDGPSAVGNNNNNNNNTAVCGSCDAGFYLEKGVCIACPLKTTSNAGAVGIQACVCPAGNRAVRIINAAPTNTTSTQLQSFSLICEPCPKGYFSHTLGSACTPCGKGMTTMLMGATSLRDCVPNNNL